MLSGVECQRSEQVGSHINHGSTLEGWGQQDCGTLFTVITSLGPLGANLIQEISSVSPDFLQGVLIITLTRMVSTQNRMIRVKCTTVFCPTCHLKDQNFLGQKPGPDSFS